MSEAVSAAVLPATSITALTHEVRSTVPALTAAIVAQVQREVSAYAGPVDGERHRLITMAVDAAIHQYLDVVAGGSPKGRRVNELFRRMGYGEARDNNSLEPMRAALHIAGRHAWGALRDFTRERDLSADLLGQLTDGVIDYLAHLEQQVTEGYELARHSTDTEHARAQLLGALLGGADSDEIERLAVPADWAVPARLVLLAITFHGAFPDWPDLPTVLARTTESPAIVVCPAVESEAVIEELRHLAPGLRVAVSWPVAADQASDAHRWTTRALELVDQGVIAPTPVISCADHHTQLWLHAEPTLRRRLVQQLLPPLLAETPNSREILSETLLVWLETRGSAPAIAAQLGVHPQTVRYRWKRINDLFGEDLHDPEFMVQITMVLKASVPLWKADDQSDFDQFRAQEGD